MELLVIFVSSEVKHQRNQTANVNGSSLTGSTFIFPSFPLYDRLTVVPAA